MTFAGNDTQDFGSSSFRCRRGYINRLIVAAMATVSRPTGETGMMIFDTTLGQPIWYDGTNWVDAQGVTV